MRFILEYFQPRDAIDAIDATGCKGEERGGGRGGRGGDVYLLSWFGLVKHSQLTHTHLLHLSPSTAPAAELRSSSTASGRKKKTKKKEASRGGRRLRQPRSRPTTTPLDSPYAEPGAWQAVPLTAEGSAGGREERRIRGGRASTVADPGGHGRERRYSRRIAAKKGPEGGGSSKK